MKVYPQLINNLELTKAKVGARALDKAELIYFPTKHNDLSIVFMEVPDTKINSERVLVTSRYMWKFAKTKEELLEKAVENLKELPQEFVNLDKKRINNTEIDETKIFTLQGVDGFESSRILLDDVLQKYKDMTDDFMYVITPSVDVCMIFLGKEYENLAQFMATQIFNSSGEYRLTQNVITYTP